MSMNRRNVLVGLGTIVAGGGAALGTGAFSSVEAGREATISTEGDGAALLQLDIDTEFNGVSDTGSEDVIEFNFEDLNRDAKTTFEGALTVANSGSEPVDFSVDDIDGDDGVLTFESGDKDLSDEEISLEADGSISSDDNTESIDIIVDLEGKTDENIDEIEITFLAE